MKKQHVSDQRMRQPSAKAIFVLLVSLATALMTTHPCAATVPADEMPNGIKEVGFDQNLGTLLPLDTRFVDDRGQAHALGDYFGDKPVALAFVYYECPMLCSMTLNGIVASLRALEFAPGEEFELVIVSFDPTEGPELAAAKKANYLKSYGRPETADGWHFMTGEASEIERLTGAAGFHYTWDEKRQEYAHAAGLILATPDGRIAKYYYGIDFAPRDVRLGLVEASESKIGNAVDQVLLYCFHYDPATGQYSVAAISLMRIFAVLTLLALATFMAIMFKRERKQRLARQWAETR